MNPVFGLKTNPDFSEKQEEAWNTARRLVDESIPCYGWEMEQPEYYVVTGYDDTGYYYNGPGIESAAGPKPWRELGNTEIGIIEMYGVTRGQAADDSTTVRDALTFALKHAGDPGGWVLPGYRSGLPGWDLWIETVEQGEASGLGMSYNAAVWAECRALGLKFLDEARQRFDESLAPLFEEAIENYFPVVDGLSCLVELFPLPQDMGLITDIRRDKALTCLASAREAEEQALGSLDKIAAAL